MKLSFINKKSFILLMSTTLILLVIFGGYFVFISPKLNERAQAQTQLEMEKKMLDVLITNENNKQPVSEERQTTELQRKLPVAPLIDQLLLDFQRVEAMSNTLILHLDITENETETAAQSETSQEAVSTDQQFDILQGTTSKDQQPENSQGNAPTEQQSEESENPETAIETNQASRAAINGLKQITVHLTIRANTYDDLFQFLVQLDRLQRMISIDSISFMGNNEKIMVDDEQTNLEFYVTISTFYYPELSDLRDELPKVIHPKPSEKKNPLHN